MVPFLNVFGKMTKQKEKGFLRSQIKRYIKVCGQMMLWKKLIFPNNKVYKGETENLKMRGKAVLRYENEDIYDGSFVKGTREGFGRYNYKNG